VVPRVPVRWKIPLEFARTTKGFCVRKLLELRRKASQTKNQFGSDDYDGTKHLFV